jgi:large subunit ribosomal protein L9
LPRGYAAPATPAILKRAEKLAAEEEQRQQSLDEQAQGLVGKLEGQTLVMAVRVGEQGRLYGSVTNADIAEKAGEILGEELDRRRILLPEVIRQVGLFTVPIRLSRNVTTEAQVAVVDVDAPEGVEAAVQALLTQSAEAEEAAIAAWFPLPRTMVLSNPPADVSKVSLRGPLIIPCSVHPNLLNRFQGDI